MFACCMRFKVLSDYIEINNLYTFKCATNLVDGNEVTYTSSYVDKIYARIDTASTPGYFTLKN